MTKQELKDTLFILYSEGKTESLGVDNIVDWVYDTFVGKKDTEKVADWIEQWADLFPRGVRAGNKAVRSHPKDLLPKMKEFIKVYAYSKDEVFEATRAYLSEREEQDWFMTKCSIYFIHKRDEGSALAEWCDRVRNKDKNVRLTEEVRSHFV